MYEKANLTGEMLQVSRRNRPGQTGMSSFLIDIPRGIVSTATAIWNWRQILAFASRQQFPFLVPEAPCLKRNCPSPVPLRDMRKGKRLTLLMRPHALGEASSFSSMHQHHASLTHRSFSPIRESVFGRPRTPLPFGRRFCRAICAISRPCI